MLKSVLHFFSVLVYGSCGVSWGILIHGLLYAESMLSCI